MQNAIAKDYLTYLSGDPESIKSQTLAGLMSHYDDRKGIKKPKVKPKTKKNVKVKCWHCGNPDQVIKSYEDVFSCDKCKESLWTGEGGYQEISVGVWR